MKIKQIISIIFALFFIVLTKAQKTDDLLNSRVVLSVVMPENAEKISASNFAKIKSKIKQIISKNDVAATDYFSDFVIYPSIEIYDEDIIDAGLTPSVIISGDFSLFVKQVSTNNLYGSITVGFKGAGSSKNRAVRSGVSKLNANHPDFQKFLGSVKAKIIDYYQKNCAHFISEADKFNRSNRQEQALTTLLSIPAGTTSCNSKIKAKVIEYYKSYSNKVCEEKMQMAKGYAAEKEFSKALSILRSIDPSSKCRSTSLNLINNMKHSIEKEDKKAYDLTLRMYKDQVDIEKARLKSIKDIAIAYYKNQPDTKINVIK